MPFRFSEFVKRGNSGNPYIDVDDRMPRPMSADSYDFNPHQAPAAQVPCETRTPDGTGRPGPQFLREGRSPPFVQTTHQLAEFIKHRDQPQFRRSSTCSSQYSHADDLPTKGLHCSSPGYSALSYHEGPLSGTQPSRTGFGAPSNHHIVGGLRNRYAVEPISRVLPGATKRHKYEGFWLARGTMKTEGDIKARQKFWIKSRGARPGSSDDNDNETSGWY